MKFLIQQFKKLLANKNVWRAAIVYGVSLVIGLLGFFIISGVTGDYFLTCSPGFGTGVAIALLNNGENKPVTLKSSASTFIMLLVFTVGAYVIGISLLAVFVGFGFSLVGSLIGLKYCSWQNKRYQEKISLLNNPEEK